MTGLIQVDDRHDTPMSPRGPFRLEHIRALQLSEAQRRALQATMSGVMHAVYTPDERGSERIEPYLSAALDTQVNDHFNEAVVFYDDVGAVGFLHLYARLRRVAGRSIEVMRANIAVVPSHQGVGLTTRGFTRIARTSLRHFLVARRPRYFVGSTLSPVVYRLIARRCRIVVPATRTATREANALYEALFGDEPLEDYGVEVGASESTRAWIADSTDPAIRFFLDRNPDWAGGFGLNFVARVNAADVPYALASSGLWRLASRLRRRRR